MDVVRFKSVAEIMLCPSQTLLDLACSPLQRSLSSTRSTCIASETLCTAITLGWPWRTGIRRRASMGTHAVLGVVTVMQRWPNPLQNAQ